jgi:hypothetical protein
MRRRTIAVVVLVHDESQHEDESHDESEARQHRHQSASDDGHRMFPFDCTPVRFHGCDRHHVAIAWHGMAASTVRRAARSIRNTQKPKRVAPSLRISAIRAERRTRRQSPGVCECAGVPMIRAKTVTPRIRRANMTFSSFTCDCGNGPLRTRAIIWDFDCKGSIGDPCARRNEGIKMAAADRWWPPPETFPDNPAYDEGGV